LVEAIILVERKTKTRHAFFLNTEKNPNESESDGTESNISETGDEYEIKVKTGNIKGGGTESNIELTLIGECNLNLYLIF